MKIVESGVKLKSITPKAEKLIEEAGRCCYESEEFITKNSYKGMIRSWVKEGHESVLEHAVATFELICDRGVSHQLVRHRIASYSQSSTRYCDYSKGRFGGEITVIEPLNLTAKQKKIWLRACQESERKYMSLIKSGAKAQVARSVLPTCVRTKIFITANMREWRCIFKSRLSRRSLLQTRFVISQCFNIIKKKCPNVLYDMTLEDDYILKIR